MKADNKHVDRQVHCAFIYRCYNCGARRVLWVEKGLEEQCNPNLEHKSGLPHKPTPFAIKCPECRKLSLQHTGGTFNSHKFLPAKWGDDLFINDPNSDCGKPVFNWTGE